MKKRLILFLIMIISILTLVTIWVKFQKNINDNKNIKNVKKIKNEKNIKDIEKDIEYIEKDIEYKEYIKENINDIENINDQSGILLSFDDCNEENWEQYFDLFDKYNVKVTFFINASRPTDFCIKAQNRGHEIGYHTRDHVRLTEVSKEEFLKQAITPIKVFKENGCELTSFSYPYGAYSEWMNEELLKHYKVLRGAYYYELYPKENLERGFVEAKSIDNVNYDSDESFQEEIKKMLTEASQKKGSVVSLYSHVIDGGDWCVLPERLEYIFQKADELNLKFYTYKDLEEADNDKS